jgi:hypothetical protein
VKQGKLIMALSSAEILGCSLLRHDKTDMIKRVSLGKSADGITMIFGRFDRPACIKRPTMGGREQERERKKLYKSLFMYILHEY